jgi:membrane associated rhomboid family serine protease
MIPCDTIRSFLSHHQPGLDWHQTVFLFEVSLSPAALDRFIFAFGLVPERLNLTNLPALLANPGALVTLVTHMFLHGGWVHFLSNMWILFIFGDNVEDRMGSGRFIFFYLFSGLLPEYLGVDPCVASRQLGPAIAGVLGAYFILFPGALSPSSRSFVPGCGDPALFYLGFGSSLIYSLE